MTTGMNFPEIMAIKQLIQKNLEIVHKVLGIETACDEDKITEMEFELEIVADKVVYDTNNSTTTKTTSEILEQRYYLATKSAEMKATFTESQALFTKSRALFAESRALFINRQQARSQHSQN